MTKSFKIEFNSRPPQYKEDTYFNIYIENFPSKQGEPGVCLMSNNFDDLFKQMAEAVRQEVLKGI